MKGESTQIVKSTIRKIDFWLRPALNIKTSEATAPANTAKRATMRRKLGVNIFSMLLSYHLKSYIKFSPIENDYCNKIADRQDIRQNDKGLLFIFKLKYTKSAWEGMSLLN